MEDLPYALVFYRSLGRVAGIDMPVSDSLIAPTSALCERDCAKEGRAVVALGLGGLSTRGILEVTAAGF